jgi:NO-binding membrane sensor protein with MHYT domain
MDNLNLPQAITIGRLHDALSLQALGDINALAQSVSLMSIQTLHFTGIKTFSLPLVGAMITLEPSDNWSISLTLVISNETTTLLFAQKDPTPWPLFCVKRQRIG